MQGKVKWFSNEKGYGFIVSNNGDEHYFNVREIIGIDLPKNGDVVEFESKKGSKGYKAIKIKIISKAKKKEKEDDRINCPNCGKKIVPRLITYQGEPQKSVCPYCATVVKQFDNDLSWVYYFPLCRR